MENTLCLCVCVFVCTHVCLTADEQGEERPGTWWLAGIQANGCLHENHYAPPPTENVPPVIDIPLQAYPHTHAYSIELIAVSIDNTSLIWVVCPIDFVPPCSIAWGDWRRLAYQCTLMEHMVAKCSCLEGSLLLVFWSKHLFNVCYSYESYSLGVSIYLFECVCRTVCALFSDLSGVSTYTQWPSPKVLYSHTHVLWRAFP